MKNKIIAALAVISMAGMTGACAQLQASDVEQVQNQDLAIIPVTFVTEEDDLTFTMELAKSEREQAIGLMNRTELGERSGMVFPFSPPRQASFWMKNTLIPLDLIFVDTQDRIVRIAHNAQPHDLTPISSGVPVAAVIEIQGGLSQKLGITEGSTVKYDVGN